MTQGFPVNLERLSFHEGDLRRKAITLAVADERLRSHLSVIEKAMIIAEKFSQLDAADDDFRVVQLLAIRCFDGFASALKLALDGYGRHAALVLRDILETDFLLDLFAGDRSSIERYRTAGKEDRTQFSPLEIAVHLDANDGSTGQGRRARHTFLSELSGHPATQAALLDRPMRNGGLALGPMVEGKSLDRVLFEMARLADGIGDRLEKFFPPGVMDGMEARFALKKERLDRMRNFHSTWLPPGHKTA